MKRDFDTSVSRPEQAAAYKRVGAALVAVGEDAEKLKALNQAVASRSRERYQAFISDLRDAGFPLGPEDCPIVTVAASVYVPAGFPICVWAVGPQQGQIYREPTTLTIEGGAEVPTPTWWTFILEQLGVIECTQPLVRRWDDIHGALCGGGPDLSARSAAADGTR